MEKYMQLALKEAYKSYKCGDVPVGAVIVYNNKVVAKGYNKKEKNNDPTRHAEIEAIRKATRKLKTWHLDGCTIYITMEPCLMCAGAILQARIENVVYAVNNEKFGYSGSIENVFNNKKNNHHVNIYKGICEKEATEMLVGFFKQKRS